MGYQEDVDVCRQLHKQHGKNYYFATWLFPKDLREATFVLYAFFRVPDEFVDAPGVDPETAAMELRAWRQKWERAYETRQSDEPVLRAAVEVFHRYGIPYEYAAAFFDAMAQDVTVDRYATYEDLCGYMYGSAAVVGLMMSYVIGFAHERALEHATELGYAMQLTNFLRDVGEDWEDRQRVYVPEEDLSRFGLTRSDIENRVFDERMRALMIDLAQRARRHYAQAEQGIRYLSARGRFAVRAGSRLYEALLTQLEQQDWNPYAGRASTTLWQKWLLLPSALKEKTWSSSDLGSVD